MAAVIALLAMSFTSSTNKVQIVKTEKGAILTNVNLLSLQDLDELDELTVVGAKKTTLVNKTVKDNWVNETVYTTEDVPEPTKGISAKLNNILAKY